MKRFVSKGDGSYKSASTSEVVSDLRNEGFALGIG
jgi:hypothetical protein